MKIPNFQLEYINNFCAQRLSCTQSYVCPIIKYVSPIVNSAFMYWDTGNTVTLRLENRSLVMNCFLAIKCQCYHLAASDVGSSSAFYHKICTIFWVSHKKSLFLTGRANINNYFDWKCARWVLVTTYSIIIYFCIRAGKPALSNSSATERISCGARHNGDFMVITELHDVVFCVWVLFCIWNNTYANTDIAIIINNSNDTLYVDDDVTNLTAA